MIEISSQMREFVNFAQDAAANDAKDSIARLGDKESRYSAFSIHTAADGDSVGKLRRSTASKNANNTVRAKFREAVEQMFGGAERIPAGVLAAMHMKDYQKGKPLTADRILDVYAAIQGHIKGLKDAAFRAGTLRAVDAADTAADKFIAKFQAKIKANLGGTVASNLKRTLILCAANSLDDAAVKGGPEALKKFARNLNSSFMYTLKAIGFDAESRMIDVSRIQNLMKDEVHMRHTVFALLDKDGNVDVNHFDRRLAFYDDPWLKRGSSGILRANLETLGPAAVKELQREFGRMAVQKAGDAARDEIDAFFQANPDKIPASLRDDRRAAIDYKTLVKEFVTGREVKAVADRMAYAGDATARIDTAAGLRDFQAFMDSIYALAEGDKDLVSLIERFAGKIALDSEDKQRPLEEIKARFIDPVRANLEELRAVADGNANILKAGIDVIARNQMKASKKGVLASLANAAKNVGQAVVKSISDHPKPDEVAKAFADMFAQFKKAMPLGNYNDQFDREERNSYLQFFAGVAMEGLDRTEKEYLTMVFSTDPAKIASNVMQTLVQDGSMDPLVKTDMQDTAYMMRECTSFLADDIGFDADALAVNHVIETMKFETLPANVAAQFTDIVKGIQG